MSQAAPWPKYNPAFRAKGKRFFSIGFLLLISARAGSPPFS
jgi:hypothetical protein